MKDNVNDFHFVMGRRMKERIMAAEVLNDCRGLSGRIVKILSVLSPLIDRKHRWGKEKMVYLPVSKDPDEIRNHVHVYIPRNFYRRLKLLHQDLNVYSIAQLVRAFVGLFLGLVETCTGDVFKELENVFSAWAEEDDKVRLTPRECLRQLMAIIRHLPGKNRLVTIYDWKFSPFWVLRM